MPIYTCPECGAKLKKNKELEPGKKLRCSECEVIFAIPGEKKKPAPAPIVFEDEDGPAQYGVITDPADEAAEKVRKAAFDPTKERFEKSKRGPALELVVRPSNVLLFCGVLTCLMALGGAFASSFQLIFKVQEVQEQKGLYTKPGDSKVRYKELTDEQRSMRYWGIAGSVLFFLWGTVVCGGASKMHELEKYWLAMTGSIMALLGPLVPLGIWLYLEGTSEGEPDMAFVGPAILCFASGLPASIWSISTLRNEKVLAGYAEEPVE
jgi:hypothetical protein